MQRKLALSVLREVLKTCQESLSITGYYIRTLDQQTKDKAGETCELVVIATLNEASRRQIQAIVSKQRLEMDEVPGFVIIHTPAQTQTAHL